MDATYTVSGYAYGGGGIGLTRVEVSFDDGKVRAENIMFCFVFAFVSGCT